MSAHQADMSDLGQLVPVTSAKIGDSVVPTCNGRDLHAYLQVKRDYTSWVKGRITKYGFAEGTDYATEVVTKSGDNLRGGRPERGHHLTLDMGKELGMVENNPMGRAVRRYFIECERLGAGQTQPGARPHWTDRSNEDRQIELKTIAAYGKYCSTSSAWWYAEKHAGMPIPPRSMQPAWRQAEMPLKEPRRVTTISVTTEEDDDK